MAEIKINFDSITFAHKQWCSTFCLWLLFSLSFQHEMVLTTIHDHKTNINT